MMYIYILLFLFVIMLVGSYFLFKKEIAQPALIFLAMYTVSIFCAVLNIKTWGIDMKPETFWILLLGAIEFVVISYLVSYYMSRKYKVRENVKYIDDIDENKYFSNTKIFIIMFIIYDLIVLGILIYNIRAIALRFGEYESVSNMLFLYRQHTSYNHDAHLPSYVTLLLKPFMASAYVFNYVFINKVLSSNKGKVKVILNNLIYLFPMLMYIIHSYIQSNREGIIIITLNTITMFIVVWSIKNKWKKTVQLKSIGKMVIAGIIGLIVFYFSAAWVGRINSKGMFDYITFYAGGSIECFNQYVQYPEDIKVVRGEETFYSLIGNLDSMGITKYDLRNKLTGHLEFRYYNGEMVGNVYTAYRRWMHDYGLLGIAILQAIMATILQILYNSIKYQNRSKNKQGLLVLLYSYLAYTIYMHPIGEYFYFDVISKASLAIIICMFILLLVVTNIRIGFENKKINISRKV